MDLLCSAYPTLFYTNSDKQMTSKYPAVLLVKIRWQSNLGKEVF